MNPTSSHNSNNFIFPLPQFPFPNCLLTFICHMPHMHMITMHKSQVSCLTLLSILRTSIHFLISRLSPLHTETHFSSPLKSHSHPKTLHFQFQLSSQVTPSLFSSLSLTDPHSITLLSKSHSHRTTPHHRPSLNSQHPSSSDPNATCTSTTVHNTSSPARQHHTTSPSLTQLTFTNWARWWHLLSLARATRINTFSIS